MASARDLLGKLLVGRNYRSGDPLLRLTPRKALREQRLPDPTFEALAGKAPGAAGGRKYVPGKGFQQTGDPDLAQLADRAGVRTTAENIGQPIDRVLEADGRFLRARGTPVTDEYQRQGHEIMAELLEDLPPGARPQQVPRQDIVRQTTERLPVSKRQLAGAGILGAGAPATWALLGGEEQPAVGKVVPERTRFEPPAPLETSPDVLAEPVTPSEPAEPAAASAQEPQPSFWDRYKYPLSAAGGAAAGGLLYWLLNRRRQQDEDEG